MVWRSKVVRHTKTGKKYIVLRENVIECTNGREELRYVIYKRFGMIFCREQKEFWAKFEEVKR